MENSETAWLHATCSWLKRASSDGSAESVCAAVAQANFSELSNLLSVLQANFEELSGSPQRLRILMQAIASRVQSPTAAPSMAAQHDANQATDLDTLFDPELLIELYEMLLEVEATAASHLLQVLATQADEESLEALAATLSNLPPSDWQLVGLALSPLWKVEREPLELFFARLDETVLHPSTMTVLLDLAGYSLRKGKLSEHPWRGRSESLQELLRGVIARLRNLEADPAKFGSDVQTVQRVLGESLALTVALCDALALIADPTAEDCLLSAVSLKHRRVQAEAAGALARLGSAAGKQKLIELAEDSVARLRAVTYAEELGFADEIDEQLRLPEALAESELAQWLAAAEQFGFPPADLELIDFRTQYWPSYEEPRNCYLFRYTYRLPEGQISNIGIAGPLTHAFHADLANLPVDDIYAAFAGWQAEHEDIFEVPTPMLNPAQWREADRLIAALERQGYSVEQTVALTFLLGEIALLAAVARDGKKQIVTYDGLELLAFPLSSQPTALSPEIVLAIYRGRKLLRSFNP